MGPPRWLRFVERPFPSSNMVVIAADKSVLVDTGYGSDLARTEGLLAQSGIGPADLSLVVNTHHHSDHVGGNAGLQGRHGAPVAAHRWEAQMVNRRDPEAAHADDVAWINPFREGAGAIGRAMESVERLADLEARWACSGHGPAIVEPERALAAARERYEGWLQRPKSAAWHACKRIAAYALMIRDGLAEEEATDHFASRPWAADFARHAFEADPREFARALIKDLLRSGAVRRSGGRLLASARTTGPRPTGTPPIPGPETGRPPKRRRNGPTGTVARIVETTGKEKDEQARGPADRGVFRRARGR